MCQNIITVPAFSLEKDIKRGGEEGFGGDDNQTVALTEESCFIFLLLFIYFFLNHKTVQYSK